MITSTRPWLTTWGEVVEWLAELYPEDMVCFGTGPNSADDPCLVVVTVELEEDEDVPPEAAERGWTKVLITDEIVDVVRSGSRSGAPLRQEQHASALRGSADDRVACGRR